MSAKAYHAPTDNGKGVCTRCGKNVARHRPRHAADGDPCTRCGLPSQAHREPSTGPRKAKKKPKVPVGIDGEGRGRRPHLYTLIAASDETGKHRWHDECLAGLSTERCLDFVLGLPNWVQPYGFSFRYDLTMMLKDLDAKSGYDLFRPETRTFHVDGQKRHRAVYWSPDDNFVRKGSKVYKLDFMSGKITIQRGVYGQDTEPSGLAALRKGTVWARRRRVVWDVFRFYGCSFVKALEDWNAAPEEEIRRIREMKEKRGEFEHLLAHDIRKYCYRECTHLARLVRLLVEAHEACDLQLRNFYGAGSTADAMLRKHGIREQIKLHRKNFENEPLKEKLAVAFASAFFGGRFENSRVGTIAGPLFSYDISSAYPFELSQLPCLAHGRWRHTKRRSFLADCTTAVVRYSLGRPPKGLAWAPFPFRCRDGTIVYPSRSAGGWVWLSEFLAGEKLFREAKDYVRFHEAYVFESECACPPPMGFLPEYYRERVRIGKDGKGIVLKLGPNSTYGKTAQAVGGDLGPYTDWVWAGMTTAGTRAQILDLIGRMTDPRKLFAVATDGVLVGERLKLPRPLDTGTFDLVNERGEPVDKPLGGWEEKIGDEDESVFAVRPGVFFPIGDYATEELCKKKEKEVRARGVGRHSLFLQRKAIVEAFESGQPTCVIPDLDRFCGAKSSIARYGKNPKEYEYSRSPRYGDWYVGPQYISFNPLPKRLNERMSDGTLKLRAFGKNVGMSKPYRKALDPRDSGMSPEARELKDAEERMIEQPDPGIEEEEWADAYET